MAAEFPTSVANFTNPNPATDDLDTAVGGLTHSGQHGKVNDEIEATQTKIGSGSSTPTSGKVLRGTGAGTSGWGQITNADVDAAAAILGTKIDIHTTGAIGAALADADEMIVYDASATANKMTAVTRITDYAFGKVSGDIGITSSGTSSIQANVIVDGDISNSAEIAVSKLADGDAYALLRTASDGTSVEWGSAGQIVFPATQNASSGANVLDDYEEGTFTPVVGDATHTFTPAGAYTKIGRLVHYQTAIYINQINTASRAQITGYPFSATSSTYSYHAGSIAYFGGIYSNVVLLTTYIVGTVVKFTSMAAAGAGVTDAADTLTSGTLISLAHTCFV